ncbi:MAG: AAA family ATPase [Magnetococcales bacterium]|nr:AAA family ATPase [Magnetococcales bacterium]MBF0321870.1 AAA family ATPase [Magnetococcales bacterium]
MLKRLTLQNVGPAPSMVLQFGERLNLLTGDNGLGKTFLLDIVWWALTRTWPAELNNKLSTGMMARPYGTGEASIEFTLSGKTKPVSYTSRFDRPAQTWAGRGARPAISGLVIYSQADGSFSVWDSARNSWRTKGEVATQERQPAYVFTPAELWDGLKGGSGRQLCNGLVADWAGWFKENKLPLTMLTRALSMLSPGPREVLAPGPLTRISPDDARDIPTLRMPYGQDVPILHASAGMRRIITLCYLLTWVWQEHLSACQLLDISPSRQVVFLVDEIEAHLHPRWQRSIIRALMETLASLGDESGIKAGVQLMVATHAPLVLASVEPFFDSAQDAWFDIDLVHGTTPLQDQPDDPSDTLEQNETYLYDVFFSYAHQDRARVLKLAERLKSDGLEVWIDVWKLRAGDSISEAVMEGLRNAKVAIVVLSSHSIRSQWIQLEYSAAITRDPMNKTRRFIPIFLDDCEIPTQLRNYFALDYRQEDEAAYQKLLKFFSPTGQTGQKRIPASRVEIAKQPFYRHGDVTDWLTSEAFDLGSGRSLEAEIALEKAGKLMSEPAFDAAQAKMLEEELKSVLGDIDPFWARWRFVMDKKGWNT